MPSSSSSMAVVVPPRTGRHRQRYHNNLRLVSGCIPYKMTTDCGCADDDDDDDGDDMETRIRVLMISTPNRSDLVFPKGGWENDEDDKEAACREAFEEAGVRGILKDKPLGDWEFKSKSRQERCSMEGGCRGRMFALKVTEELETWPEQKTYDRKWLNVKDAYRLCRYEWMRRALDEFLRVMNEEREHDERMEVAVGGNPESPSVAVSSDAAEHSRTSTASCNFKASSAQHLDLLAF